MTREELLKNHILKNYRSVRDFCISSDIPYSTVDSIFKRGILKSSVSVVIRICDRLGIDIDSLIDGQIKEKGPELGSLTLRERTLVYAYRNNPSMQEAVDKLLNIPSDGPTVGYDIASTVAEAVQKSLVKK